MSDEKPTFEQEQQRLAALPRDQRFEELLNFPCEHTFKVIGKPQGLEQRACQALAGQGHPDPGVSLTPSKGGKWLSLGLTVQVNSGAELDRLYTALEGLEGVRYLL